MLTYRTYILSRSFPITIILMGNLLTLILTAHLFYQRYVEYTSDSYDELMKKSKICCSTCDFITKPEA